MHSFDLIDILRLLNCIRWAITKQSDVCFKNIFRIPLDIVHNEI